MPPSAATLAIALPASPAAHHEPVSPELVLVDPVLAERERARLVELADASNGTRTVERGGGLPPLVDLSTLRRTFEPFAEQAEAMPPRQSLRKRDAAFRRKLMGTVVLISLFINGVFVARMVTHQGRASTPSARAVTSAAAAPRSGAASFRAGAAVVTRPTTKAGVERLILSMMLRSPRRNIPRQLIDTTTGLFKNNVTTVCRRDHGSRSFLCVIKAATRPAREGLYVRYWPKRRGNAGFFWYGYRNG